MKLEDSDVMERIQHVPVRAGSAVFWDNRIPHANAYRHDGELPRSVVYCSFLPDVPINRVYVSHQLKKWQHEESPDDQWIGDGTKIVSNDNLQQEHRHDVANQSWLTPLARKLMGIEPW